MESHIVKILATEFVTHNVKRFKIEKPAVYSYIPGQATDVSINHPGLKDELRPFTFTSLNNDDHLEFTIKIYTGHDGITEKLGALSRGDELIIHEVFGAIQYKGPGVFIAGGAGVTPFIAILRSLHKTGGLASNMLLFANKTEDDIILKEEFEAMLGSRFINVIDHPKKAETPARYIDQHLLKEHIKPEAYYYICGPDPFIAAMIAHLKGLGVEESQIVIEQ
jgi:ferredoxin-NADP reductase